MMQWELWFLLTDKGVGCDDALSITIDGSVMTGSNENGMQVSGLCDRSGIFPINNYHGLRVWYKSTGTNRHVQILTCMNATDDVFDTYLAVCWVTMTQQWWDPESRHMVMVEEEQWQDFMTRCLETMEAATADHNFNQYLVCLRVQPLSWFSLRLLSLPNRHDCSIGYCWFNILIKVTCLQTEGNNVLNKWWHGKWQWWQDECEDWAQEGQKGTAPVLPGPASRIKEASDQTAKVRGMVQTIKGFNLWLLGPTSGRYLHQDYQGTSWVCWMHMQT